MNHIATAMDRQSTHFACSGKTPYVSKAEAMRCLIYRQKRGAVKKNGRGPLRPYRCDHCKQWHLGSSAL